MVRFNTEEVPGFEDSVAALGGNAIDEIVDALEAIENRNLTWEEFKQDYGWKRLVLATVDTYPGADELHWFGFTSAAGNRYQIAAKGPYDLLVLCAVAVRKP